PLMRHRLKNFRKFFRLSKKACSQRAKIGNSPRPANTAATAGENREPAPRPKTTHCERRCRTTAIARGVGFAQSLAQRPVVLTVAASNQQSAATRSTLPRERRETRRHSEPRR